MQSLKNKVFGGSFILNDIEQVSIVTPEDMTEEQKMMIDMTEDFVNQEIAPHEEQLETLDYDLTIKLLNKAAELGLLGVNIPENFGGIGLDKVTATYISELISRTNSFTISLNTQTGIGSLPIVYFGTVEQKQKYLPEIASGKRIGAYCLTEPSSGTDALGAKTTSVLSEDGKHYILNGSKAFITNGGFADLFIVYAKVDGKYFTAFIVEKGMEGFTIGPEEKKMGIKASSTCPLFFENVHVPVENVLGEIGKGHLIAFNILNIGRHTLAVNSTGTAKEALEISAKYANERLQFGKKISEFPLIAKKLAEMNMKIYALETMVYRTAGLFDHILQKIDHSSSDAGTQSLQLIAEYAIECSINKVFGSEVLDFIADEAVQIHGGYGFIQEYKVERIYRDSRINRIFEGTNEINRVLIASTLVKKALNEDIPLLPKVKEFDPTTFEIKQSFTDVLEKETYLEDLSKQVFYYVSSLVLDKYGDTLDQEQEMLAHLADILIQIFAMNGVIERTKKIIALRGEEISENAVNMTKVFVQEAFDVIQASAKEVLTATVMEEDRLETKLSELHQLTKHVPLRLTTYKRKIAEQVVREEKYTI